MKHLSARTAIAAAASAALLGTAAPAAVAAPHADRPAHATKADRDTAKAERETARESAKADRETARAARAEARVTRLLTRVQESRKLTQLEDVNEAAVAANIAADLAAVNEDMRPEVYRLVINHLRFAERLAVAAEGDAEAGAGVAEVVATLHTVNASTPKAELRAAKRALQEWASLLEEPAEEPAPVDSAPADSTDGSTV